MTTLICVGTLVVIDRLTVETAAATAIFAGALPALVLLPQLREIGRPRFRWAVAREAVPFGFKAWLGGLGNVANVRLDQLLMIRLVEPRELGLYAVAFSIAGILVTPAVSALAAGSMPRFTTGDVALIARVLRTTMLGVAVTSVGVAVLAPLAVPIVFGDAFADAVPMVWVLLAAGVPLAGITILSTAMTSKGRPGFFGRVRDPDARSNGARPVPAAAGDGWARRCPREPRLLHREHDPADVRARRHFGASGQDLLVVRREDFAALRGLVSARLNRFRDRRSKAA